jgi:mRNA-degrading endonuclease toxin of MazEF toxin-antitoxin module
LKNSSIFGVYTTKFPYLDATDTKIRPVIAIGKPQGKHNVIVVIPLSSKPKQVDVDTVISDWKSAGLVNNSVARVHRLTTILQSDLLSELGTLSLKDIETLKGTIRELFSL